MAKNEEIQGDNPPPESVIRSAALISLGTMSSRVLGLARDIAISSLFSRTVTDIFVVAFRLPNTFRRLLGEGSLSVSFIPIFVEQDGSAGAGKSTAMRLANAIFTLLMLVSSILCVFGVLFMEPLMNVLVSGDSYQKIAGKVEQTVELARIMFGYLFLVTTYAYFAAIANAKRRFFIPALAPAVFNLFVILAALAPFELGRDSGQLLAWGVLVGGVAQAGMVTVLLIKIGYLPKLSINLRLPGVGLVLRNMLPGLLGLGVYQIMSLVNINFASRLAEGAHTYIYLGDRILELPQALIAISLGTALLPIFSSLVGSGQREAMVTQGNRYLRFLLFLSLPSAVGMFVLAEPIVQVLFGHREFGPEDVKYTATVVQIYAFLLVASSVSKVIVPSFYAIKNTWLPAVVSAATLLAHIILASFLIQEYQLAGLVASTAVTGILNMVSLYFFYNLMIGKSDLKALLRALLRMCPGLFGMLIVLFVYSYLVAVSAIVMSLQLAQTISLLVTILLAVLVYFNIARWMGIINGSKFFLIPRGVNKVDI